MYNNQLTQQKNMFEIEKRKKTHTNQNWERKRKAQWQMENNIYSFQCIIWPPLYTKSGFDKKLTFHGSTFLDLKFGINDAFDFFSYWA